MKRTHLSLYYLVGYIVPSGLLLLLVPSFATKLLLSNHVYEDAPLRLAGLVLLALGLVIAQIVRLRVEVLYTTTLIVRAVLSFGLLALLISTGDPFFGVVLVVVLIGVALTATGYVLDRREATATRTATA